jgi:hypothetical protein
VLLWSSAEGCVSVGDARGRVFRIYTMINDDQSGASVPVQDKGRFQAAPFARASTPETAALAPGASGSVGTKK